LFDMFVALGVAVGDENAHGVRPFHAGSSVAMSANDQ